MSDSTSTSFHTMKPDDVWRRGTYGHPHNSEDRWLWWPIRFIWAHKDSSAWFCRHGIEAFTREKILERHPEHCLLTVKHINYVAQVWHLGRLKIKLGNSK